MRRHASRSRHLYGAVGHILGSYWGHRPAQLVQRIQVLAKTGLRRLQTQGRARALGSGILDRDPTQSVERCEKQHVTVLSGDARCAGHPKRIRHCGAGPSRRTDGGRAGDRIDGGSQRHRNVAVRCPALRRRIRCEQPASRSKPASHCRRMRQGGFGHCQATGLFVEPLQHPRELFVTHDLRRTGIPGGWLEAEVPPPPVCWLANIARAVGEKEAGQRVDGGPGRRDRWPFASPRDPTGRPAGAPAGPGRRRLCPASVSTGETRVQRSAALPMPALRRAACQLLPSLTAPRTDDSARYVGHHRTRQSSRS